MTCLLMLSSVPVVETPGHEVLLDIDFVERMKLHCQFWPGPVRCVLRRGAGKVQGGRLFSRQRLGFELVVLDPYEPLPEALIDEAGLVFCSADDTRNLSLAERMKGKLTRLVYTLESPPGLRLPAALGGGWCGHRGRLGAALRGADGLQFHGLSVPPAYHRRHRDALCFLDSRLRAPMLARADHQAARTERLLARAPLTLAYIGPLEPETGASDLVEMAHLLHRRGMEFRLFLYGEGSLAERLRGDIAARGLAGRVKLAGAAAFDLRLALWLRQEADLLLSPRRNAHPSPICIEAMGCGVPVLGYANAMWRRLQAASAGGWISRRGSIPAMARMLLRLDGEREAVVRASDSALAFARLHTFERVFASRMTHLRAVAGME